MQYSIVKDSSADLGVNSKIVQIRPTVKAVCAKISKFWNFNFQLSNLHYCPLLYCNMQPSYFFSHFFGNTKVILHFSPFWKIWMVLVTFFYIYVLMYMKCVAVPKLMANDTIEPHLVLKYISYTLKHTQKPNFSISSALWYSRLYGTYF